MSTLAAVRGRFGSRSVVAVAAGAAIFAPGTGMAASPGEGPGRARIAGPDVAFRSAPGLERRVGSGPISATKLERKLKGLARRAPGSSGYYVADIEAKRGAVLFDRAEDARRKLASNQKLFTTSTALSVLGADSRIETRVKVEGRVSRAGTLQGDLYLIGGGDPSLGTAGMADLANDVSDAGVEKVSGTVVGDDGVFDRLRGVPDSDFGPSPYIAPLGGLVYAGSTYSQDPAKAAAQAFREKLRDVGVKITGRVKRGVLPKQLRKADEVGSYGSETIARLAAATNKPSNNFYAEMLLKRLDATADHQGTTRGGAADVERYAASLGSRVSAKDGSGLTDGNKASPQAVVELLTAVREEEGVGDALFESLAVAGQDGTLSDRMDGTVAAGRCRGKTGTIDGVSNLSGYCKSGSGLVAFSLLMNGVGDYDGARAIQDEMVAQIARYRP